MRPHPAAKQPVTLPGSEPADPNRSCPRRHHGQPAAPKRPTPPSITTVKEYTFKPSERLPDVKGTSPISRCRTTRSASPSTSGPAGRRSFCQRRLQGGQGLENAGRQGVQSRAGADRQSGRDARRLRRRRRAHRLGHARHGAAVHGRLCRSSRQAARQPRHAAHLSADRLVQRRRRHRRPRSDQDRRRPARQEDRAGPELAVALFPARTCSSPAACSRPK